MMRPLIVAALVLAATPALAQDPTGKYANSPFNAWYSRQHNMQGGFCCSVADAHPYYGAYTLTPEGGVTIIMPSGEEIDIEPGRVLPFTSADPNPTGGAVWWYADGNERLTWCFALGPLT